jgi:hypothetical protein
MTGDVRNTARPRLARFASMFLVCLLVASCGIGGDDDEDPTPTETPASELESQEQPTDEPTSDAAESTPESEDPFVLIPPSPGASATPEDEPEGPSGLADSTPVRTGPEPTVTSDATEATPETTPVTTTNPPESAGTPATEASPVTSLPENAVTGSDGTSGATAAESLLEAGAGTPVATAEEADAAEVDSCDVVEAPSYSGDSSSFVTSEEVNFRIGPGSDCDSVLDGPLGEGVEMTVLSDPVVRSDDPDGILWVQVEIDGDVGWIAAEFIEAA